MEWEEKRVGQQAPTWQATWKQREAQLYSGLTRAEAALATLLRTEVKGLNDFLARVHVPGVDPQCSCGFPRQTPKHVLLFCPDIQYPRESMLQAAGTQDYTRLLNTRAGVKAATKWFLHANILQQFTLAREMATNPVHPMKWSTLPEAHL